MWARHCFKGFVRRLGSRHTTLASRLSIPQGLVVGKALPDHAETYTSDEAASDPPSEVEEAPVVAPPDVVESQVPTAGLFTSHHGVSLQAGTVASSPFPKSSPTSSSPMEVSSQLGGGVVRDADSSALVEERPEKQACLSAISQQLGEEFDEKHEDENMDFDFSSEELELLEDYDNDFYCCEDDYDDEAYDVTATPDSQLKALTFPYALQEPQLSEAELQS